MISATERRALRARSHPLKPSVLLGQHGLTPAVIIAIDEALATHELIKIRLRGVERESREQVSNEIATQMNADVVNIIGQILILFRANPEPVAPRPPVSRPPVSHKKSAPQKKPAPRAANTHRATPVHRTSSPRAAPRKPPTRRGPK